MVSVVCCLLFVVCRVSFGVCCLLRGVGCCRCCLLLVEIVGWLLIGAASCVVCGVLLYVVCWLVVCDVPWLLLVARGVSFLGACCCLLCVAC